MPVIRAIFTDFAGVPLRDTWVRITLVSRAGWSKDGTRKSTRIHSDLTDSTGLWTSPDLPAQVSYEEAGTFYQVECNGVVESFDVPAGGGPYWLADRRRAPIPVDAEWKVLPKFSELPDALALAAMVEGQVPVWNNSTKRLEPGARVTSQQLADAIGPLALKTYVDNADLGLSNRIAPLETWRPSVDQALSQKANITTTNALGERVTASESKITDHGSRITTLEGGGSGGSGGSGAIRHSALQGLQFSSGTTVADDHPQYLTVARGDNRYFPRATSDSRYAGIVHASRHRTGQPDALAPADIGAAAATHSLTEHGTTGQIVPAIVRATAEATETEYAHAALLTDVPTETAPRRRSTRQPIVHAFNVDIADVVVGATNLNLLFRYDFTVQETCDLQMLLTLYAYYASPNPPVGATAQGIISWYLYDMDNSMTRVFNGFQGHALSATVGYNAFRPQTQNTFSYVFSNLALRAGGRYRFEINGQKTAAANADLMLQLVRGSLTEIASC